MRFFWVFVWGLFLIGAVFTVISNVSGVSWLSVFFGLCLPLPVAWFFHLGRDAYSK